MNPDSTKNIYHELQVKSALNKLKRKIPYGWDLNIYRGCAHGCIQQLHETDEGKAKTVASGTGK